jgi:hypothetical protein
MKTKIIYFILIALSFNFNITNAYGDSLKDEVDFLKAEGQVQSTSACASKVDKNSISNVATLLLEIEKTHKLNKYDINSRAFTNYVDSINLAVSKNKDDSNNEKIFNLIIEPLGSTDDSVIADFADNPEKYKADVNKNLQLDNIDAANELITTIARTLYPKPSKLKK